MECKERKLVPEYRSDRDLEHGMDSVVTNQLVISACSNVRLCLPR